MRLALIQMNSRTAARDENVERVCTFVDEAASRRPDAYTAITRPTEELHR